MGGDQGKGTRLNDRDDGFNGLDKREHRLGLLLCT